MRRLLAVLSLALATPSVVVAADRPNILWLVSEDHGPQMGCYGDLVATTPTVDALAKQGMRYTHVWSNAPVCAPARTTLIWGMYATSTGGEHMRSMVPAPQGMKMYPQWLREAGYYCTNNAKTDYNTATPGQVWDESSKKAHWRNRRPGQPFFAVFNSEKSHESQVRSRPHTLVHDPAKVRVPAYHPDTPEVRHDWAQYYDGVSNADADAGIRLRELEADGLADDTIIFYYADHGPGLPRLKRTACDSGLHVPLVIVVPPKWRHLTPGYVPGGTSDRLVSFVDFAPTLLSLAGVKPPVTMQGQAFLGPFAASPRTYLFGYRGRMDERYDLVRSVTDGRFVYVRNYMPHLIPGQHVAYLFETPTTQVWKALHDAGKLTPEQEHFWSTKPPEELYDLRNDPDEVHNLAQSPASRTILERLRSANREHLRAIRDVGFLPEGERFSRGAGESPYDMARREGAYPFDRIYAAADLASNLDPTVIASLERLLEDSDSAVRYWAVLGYLMRGKPVSRRLLSDSSPYVAIAAAESVIRYDRSDEARKDAANLLIDRARSGQSDVFTRLAALSVIDNLKTPNALDVRSLVGLEKGPSPHQRYDEYVPRLLKSILGK